MNDLITEIKSYLDEKDQLEFEENVNRSFGDEEMRCIVKRDDYYFLMTLDNNNGCEFFEYGIDDSGSVSIYDLIWILEQIEIEDGA